MKYRNEFPSDARARVEAERLQAYNALEQQVGGVESSRKDESFIRCVMRIFLVFAREACDFGKKSGRRRWSDSELDLRCRDFLLSTVVDAWQDKAKDLGIRKMFFSPHNWGYALDDHPRRKIERSCEWKQYQELLLDAFAAQSVHADTLQQGGPSPARSEEKNWENINDYVSQR